MKEKQKQKKIITMFKKFTQIIFQFSFNFQNEILIYI